MKLLAQYALYMLRWQLSTPILAVVMSRMGNTPTDWTAAITANGIGALIFFWVDRWIFCRKCEREANTCR